jgi:uncharacterized membrane protein YhfC
MNLLIITYFLNGFLMIVLPIGLTIYFTRTFKQGWRLFWIGAATFVFSQILHIPFNLLVNPLFNEFGFIALPLTMQKIFISIFLGVSAGLFEELSRYIMFRFWAKDARSWGSGLLAGAGHGGIEAIFLGALALYGYIQMLAVRGVDIATLVSPDRVEVAKIQIQAYWSTAWYMTLLGAVERSFAIPLHLACSLLVLQAFIQNKFWWVFIAILFHALADGITVYISQSGFSILAIEGIVGFFAVISIGIIFNLRRPEFAVATSPGIIQPPEFVPAAVEENEKSLNETRYQ